LVDDVLETLQQLAAFHRRQLGTPVIGITGTNGKTTTKELMAAVLKEKYNILYTQGNLNNHIGVPLTLLKLNAEHELAVIEMGASHQGEIALLAEIARPNFGIVTNVGKAHLEGYGSFENIMKTKAELYQYIARNGKLVFIHSGNPFLWEMAEEAGLLEESNKKIMEYVVGASENPAVISGQVVESTPFLKMNCRTFNGSFEVQTNIVGGYNAENLMAAVTIGTYFGIENEAIKRGLENYQPQNNRSQFVETQKNKLIVDAYNANPSSMTASISNFIEIKNPDKWLILGDMLELGSQSEEEHQAVIRLLEKNNVKNIFLVGSEFKKVNSGFLHFDNVEMLNNYLTEKPLSGYIVLIKGSRGIKLENVVNNL
ncbi:UDP-N-acetylmuramoyl-tripeptide--D-alanyl-D-alanine ligase, partial [Paludibacteraceae bacterium OttesenSCG-928-F17]|nr:UDP-N-acetylmuramoyl-tripeptide--D-alanyl-D-alanine ligase [Paludibacteraceae bacterium OttesenSCG-928-F17]